MNSRVIHLLVVAATCAAGVVVLHLLGVPEPAAVTIGILALGATLFNRWANALQARRRDKHFDR